MFSLIKKIQELLSKLKRNKGLYFTAISLVSISGIAIFMYLIITMTGGVKNKVYTSISSDYIEAVNIFTQNKKENFLEISKAILNNQQLLDVIDKNDKNKLNTLSKQYNDIYKKNGLKSLIISFFPATDQKATIRNTITSALGSKSQVSGIEVQQNGVFITLIQPILLKGKFIGLIELKESIHTLKNEFEKQENNFVFLLNKKMLVKLSLKTKSGRYKNVILNYLVYQSAYSSRFYSKITDNGEDIFTKELKENNGADEIYFRTYKKVTDINGAEIGLFVMGEQVEKNNGFVNIADNMVKSVTYVSLGLVISILLFMF